MGRSCIRGPGAPLCSFPVVLIYAASCRAIDTCLHACRSCATSNHEQKAKFYRQMVLEEIDSMLLRLFEAFLEAAPQLVLQLYICTQIGLEEGTGLGRYLARLFQI